MPGHVRGSFTGTANSAVIDNATDVDLTASGTFSSSMQIQTAMGGLNGADIWVPVGAALTAPGIVSVSSKVPRKWRVANTFTSGQADYELSGMRNIELRSGS